MLLLPALFVPAKIVISRTLTRTGSIADLKPVTVMAVIFVDGNRRGTFDIHNPIIEIGPLAIASRQSNIKYRYVRKFEVPARARLAPCAHERSLFRAVDDS